VDFDFGLDIHSALLGLGWFVQTFMQVAFFAFALFHISTFQWFLKFVWARFWSSRI
jgi:hypothetical protein